MLEKILAEHAGFERIIRSKKPFKKLDFTANNLDLVNRNLTETTDFADYVFKEMLADNTAIGIGGYGEDRIIYRQRKHFSQDLENPRSIHLGTDIWAAAGEPIYAPLDGIVHSFAFNDHYGDYGPTIILQHELAGITFFTLYGHLSLASLTGLHKGKTFKAGQPLATIGPYPENGDWPQHLHFQVIKDMGHYIGDFPGVSSTQDLAHYLALCPDPNLILRIVENETPITSDES
ncbi:peptidoglycan DD-metalloendopeptidase family protein [Dyadobacter luticola]|uniref:Peptidase M23 n=1 Tax=Dyadobacter luticola TaxID=1979387 RepID=A0A5R9KV00_9BACT|nr:peptidoglycan DD-metalloendopeptidase family protein [Dyadobacter luticola]TLV00061.1 peptidase M23 [Dyadobacter luticola]